MRVLRWAFPSQWGDLTCVCSMPPASSAGRCDDCTQLSRTCARAHVVWDGRYPTIRAASWHREEGTWSRGADETWLRLYLTVRIVRRDLRPTCEFSLARCSDSTPRIGGILVLRTPRLLNDPPSTRRSWSHRPHDQVRRARHVPPFARRGGMLGRLLIAAWSIILCRQGDQLYPALLPDRDPA